MIGYLRTLALFYRRHLRVQPLRELMAVVGVAAGVALLFAVQINSQSITGSFEEITHAIDGRATLEVAARSPAGFDQSVYEELTQMPGLRAAAPLLSSQVVAVGPSGSRAVTLVGATEELAMLGGSMAREFQRVSEGSKRGLLLLTQPTAHAIGVSRPGGLVTIEVGDRTRHIGLDAALPSNKIGALAESSVAAAPLPIVQVLADLRGRITRVLVEPQPGHTSQLERALVARFGATLNIRSTASEGQLLANAAAPENQLTALFGALSLVVGVILAYNALLLASTERRRFVVYLIETGTPDSMIVASLVFDAFILGVIGSALGLLLGDAVSLLAYRAPPEYLRAAFPIGDQRVIDWQTILIALGAGMFAAFAAAALPALGVLRSGAAAEPDAVGRTLSLTRKLGIGGNTLFAAGLVLAAASLLASLLWTEATVVGLAGMVAGIVFCLPMTVHYLLKFARAAARHSGDPASRLAAAELSSSPTRSVALVATGTIAVLLVVTIGGSVSDVQRAVRRGAAETLAGSGVWIKAKGPQNVYATDPFEPAATLKRLAQVPAVRSAYVERNSFLDLATRRIWVIGVAPGYPKPIAASQLVHGSLPSAEAHLREGGWALMTQALADERHLHLGEAFTLPTPTGQAPLRLASTISNYGWLPGTVIMNGDDYARLWRTTQATQLDVALAAGVTPEQGKRAIQAALPAGSSLEVQTTGERREEVSAVLGSTLSRLNDTTTIVLIAAIASVIAMMVAAVWQRRGRLDALLSIGMSSGQLARLVFYEGGSMILAGCLIGMAGGLIAQGLVDGWLHQTTGSPVVFAPAWALGLRTIIIATGISVAAAVLAVVRTVGFQPSAAFSTE